MRLQVLAYSSVVTTYLLIVIGGYVSASNSGGACPDWPTCKGQIIPQLTGNVLIEYTHRLFALFAGILITGMVLTVWLRYKNERAVLLPSTVSFVSLIAQILLGMVTVKTDLNASVVAAHLGLASVVFGTVLVNAVAVRRISQDRTQLLQRGQA